MILCKNIGVRCLVLLSSIVIYVYAWQILFGKLPRANFRPQVRSCSRLSSSANEFPITVERLRKDLLKQPLNEPIIFNLAMVLFQQGVNGLGDVTEARGYFERATKLNPNRVASWYYLANIYEIIDDVNLCIGAYEKGLECEDKGQIGLACFTNLISLYVGLGMYEDAAKVGDRAVNTFPTSPASWCSLAIVLRDTQNLPLAKTCFDRAAELLEENSDCEVAGSVHSNLARLYQTQYLNLPLAEHHHRQVVRYLPTDQSSLYSLATLLMHQREKREEAVRLLEELLNLYPDDGKALYLLSALQGSSALPRAPMEHISLIYDNLAGNPYDSMRSDDLIANILIKNIPLTSDSDVEMDMLALDNASILELGTGQGQLGLRLRKEGLWGYLRGCDVSRGMLQIAQEVIVNKEEGEGEENHRAVYDELILDDLENVLDEYGKGAVEIILASNAFSYLGDLSSVFLKARAGLREGGVFALSIELLEDVEEVQYTLLGSEEGEVGEVIISRKGSLHNNAQEDIDRGYKLLPEAKYVHSSEYVANLALCSGFDIVDKQYGIMGWEGDKAIHGAVFLLEAI